MDLSGRVMVLIQVLIEKLREDNFGEVYAKYTFCITFHGGNYVSILYLMLSLYIIIPVARERKATETHHTQYFLCLAFATQTLMA